MEEEKIQEKVEEKEVEKEVEVGKEKEKIEKETSHAKILEAIIELTKTIANLIKEQKALKQTIESKVKAGKF